jgi:Ras-related protein Rab-5C
MGCGSSKQDESKGSIQTPANDSKQITIKLTAIGMTGVGKSSMAIRYCRNYFNDATEPTIGSSFLSKEVIHDEKNVKLEIWDTAGQERYRAITPMYYRGSKVLVLVYDICNCSSFRSLDSWMDCVKKDLPGCPIVIVGNKLDLNDHRKVEFQQAKLYAEERGCKYMETSCKTGENIDQLFCLALSEAINAMDSNHL